MRHGVSDWLELRLGWTYEAGVFDHLAHDEHSERVEEGIGIYGELGIVLLMFTAAACVVMYRVRAWRLPRQPLFPELPPLLALALLITLMLGGSWGVLFASRGFGFDLTAEDPSLRQIAQQSIGYYAITLPICMVVMLLPRKGRPPEAGRASIGRAVGVGIMTLIVAWPVVMTVGAGLALLDQLIRDASPPSVAHDTLRMLTDGPLDAWAITLMVLIVIGAGIVEEVTYRGIIQRTLRHLGMRPWLAMLLSTMIFVGMHVTVVEPHALGSLFALSLAFGWVYERTGHLAAPIAMHMAFNAGNLLLATT